MCFHGQTSRGFVPAMGGWQFCLPGKQLKPTVVLWQNIYDSVCKVAFLVRFSFPPSRAAFSCTFLNPLGLLFALTHIQSYTRTHTYTYIYLETTLPRHKLCKSIWVGKPFSVSCQVPARAALSVMPARWFVTYKSVKISMLSFRSLRSRSCHLFDWTVSLFAQQSYLFLCKFHLAPFPHLSFAPR